MKWEELARRTIEGDKHELESLGGYWFKPKKYSCQGADEIKNATFKTGQGLSDEMLKKLTPLIEGEESIEEIMGKLPPADLTMLMNSQAVRNQDSAELVKVILKYGIGESNFDITDENRNDFLEKIIEYQDIAIEMLGVIRKHNRPLVKKTSKA